MSDDVNNKALIIDPDLSNKLADALKQQGQGTTTAYTAQERQLAQQILFSQNEGHYGVFEDAPEELRNACLRDAAQRLRR